MGTKEKLIERLKRLPNDFTFDEAERLLIQLGYIKSNKGKHRDQGLCFTNQGEFLCSYIGPTLKKS